MPRTLVIQMARFGDLMQSKRLLLTLAGRSETHLVVDRSLTALAGLAFPGITVHGIMAHAGSKPTGPSLVLENRPIFDELAGLGFSEVYNLNYSGLNFALAALFDPGTVRGYRVRQGQQGMDQWLSLAFRWTRRRGSSPLNLVDLWAHLAPDPIAPDRVNPNAGVHQGQGLGVVLAGRHSRRSLPMDMLVPCVAAMLETMSTKRVTLLGSPAEKPLAQAFFKVLPPRLHDRVHDTVGKTDWTGLIDTLTGLERVLTPDTGTMHLAAHLGVPVTALFLSSAWAHETGPYGAGHTVWQASTHCTPCLESQPCDFGLECRAPFGERDFLRVLAGVAKVEPPQGLQCLASRLDGLGVTYSSMAGLADEPDGRDRDRACLRGLASEYLRLDRGDAAACADAKGANSHSQAMYEERDWMLPREVRP